MKAVQHRSIIDSRLALEGAVAGICLALVVLWISCTPGIVRAAAPPLVVVKSASPDPVVAGDTLTYIITITNTGSTALPGVVISDTAPLETIMLGTSGPDLWLMSTPKLAERRSAIWLAPAPLEPGQTVELRLRVQVALSARGAIVNDEYEVRAEGWDDAVRGAPVITRIEVPTPTATPSPTPKLSPTRPIPTLTLTPGLSPSPELEQETVAVVITNTPTPEPQPRRAGVGWLLVLLGSVVMVVVIAIVWFTRRDGPDRENRDAEH